MEKHTEKNLFCFLQKNSYLLNDPHIKIVQNFLSECFPLLLIIFKLIFFNSKKLLYIEFFQSFVMLKI